MKHPAYLLDTHIVVWMDSEPDRISADLRTTLSASASLYFSAASAGEAAIKRASGKLKLSGPLAQAANALQLIELPVTAQHGEAAGMLPRHHGDPFDRMLIAQARIERLVLVTNDSFLSRYDVDILVV